MPAVRHRQAGSSGIARIGAAENISALFQERERLCCRLPGDRRAPRHLGDRVGSRRNSAQREIMGGTDTGVPPRGKARNCTTSPQGTRASRCSWSTGSRRRGGPSASSFRCSPPGTASTPWTFAVSVTPTSPTRATPARSFSRVTTQEVTALQLDGVGHYVAQEASHPLAGGLLEVLATSAPSSLNEGR